MSGLEIALLVNLVLVGLLVGNEVGTWAVVHPALNRVPLAASVAGEQSIYRRYGYVMPPLMAASIVSGVVVAVLASGGARVAAIVGVAALVAMQIVTFAGNLPLNKRILASPADVEADEWWGLRRDWDRWHTARSMLDLAALVGFALAAVLH
jgi:hypothetical protein